MPLGHAAAGSCDVYQRDLNQENRGGGMTTRCRIMAPLSIQVESLPPQLPGWNRTMLARRSREFNPVAVRTRRDRRRCAVPYQRTTFQPPLPDFVSPVAVTSVPRERILKRLRRSRARTQRRIHGQETTRSRTCGPHGQDAWHAFQMVVASSFEGERGDGVKRVFRSLDGSDLRTRPCRCAVSD